MLDGLSSTPNKRDGLEVRPTEKGGGVILAIRWDQVHSVRTALAACGCLASKSNATDRVRRDVSTLLGYAQSQQGKGGWK